MRIIYIIVAGFIGYQIGKRLSVDLKEEFLIKKTQVLGNGLGNIEYLKIDNNGLISFVTDETLATKFNNITVQNAVRFLKDAVNYSSPYQISVIPVQQVVNIQSV
jgi:hypothetical protein